MYAYGIYICILKFYLQVDITISYAAVYILIFPQRVLMNDFLSLRNRDFLILFFYQRVNFVSG